EAKVVTSLVNAGLMSIDEWRLGEGLKPTGVKDPFIQTPIGPIFVKDLLRQSDEGQDPVAPYKPTTGEKKPSPDTLNLPIPSQAKTASDVTKSIFDEVRSDIAQAKSELDKSDKIAKVDLFYQEVRKWRKAAMNDLKKNRAFREFYSDILNDKAKDSIKKGLDKAKTKDDIFKVFYQFITSPTTLSQPQKTYPLLK
ncbi:MAG: hypothetical protein U1C56_02675, partial [Candidatus Curtissbacteria bacterium]|nr:hypothetical protein [Candidatus Curtissbacteria bacterium]